MGAEIILKYFPAIPKEQFELFLKLETLYREWNMKINVISRKDIDQLYERHVLHSLGILKASTIPDGSQVLDVGTGGGFPGIPLAIMHPGSHFHMVDSIGKKIKVVQAVCDSLELQNTSAQHVRAENVHRKYDIIVSRAVMRLRPLIQAIRAARKPEARLICLKGGDLSSEFAEIRQLYREIELKDHFEEEFFETKKVVEVLV